MKTALVLEGGGLRGVYTEGVLDALMHGGWQADYVVGVSAGANNGIYYVAGQPGDALDSVIHYVGDKRYLSLENFIRTHSVFGMDFIFHEIPERLVPLDFDRVQASSCQFEAGVTDVFTGRAVYFDKTHLADRDTTILRASCSMPGFAPVSYTHLDVYKRQRVGLRCGGPVILSHIEHAGRRVNCNLPRFVLIAHHAAVKGHAIAGKTAVDAAVRCQIRI